MKLQKSLLLALAACTLSGAAMAHDTHNAYTTFNIRLEPNPVQSDVEPVYMAPVTKEQVAFKIINNTGNPLYFAQGGEQVFIPAISNQTVTVPYQTNDFQVTDVDGNPVANWRLQTPTEPQRFEAATPEQFEDWGNRLQAVLESSRNRTWSYGNQSRMESTSQATPVEAESNTTHVRGFW